MVGCLTGHSLPSERGQISSTENRGKSNSQQPPEMPHFADGNIETQQVSGLTWGHC